MLTKEELIDYIKTTENQHIEFKTSFGKEVIESVVIFINSYGGYIFIDIKDDDSINGVDLNSKNLKDWINQIKTNTQPNILVDMQKFEIDSKPIVIDKNKRKSKYNKDFN